MVSDWCPELSCVEVQETRGRRNIVRGVLSVSEAFWLWRECVNRFGFEPPEERLQPAELQVYSVQPCSRDMAVTEADAIKDLTDEEVEDLKETFRTFDKVRMALKNTQSTHTRPKVPCVQGLSVFNPLVIVVCAVPCYMVRSPQVARLKCFESAVFPFFTSVDAQRSTIGVGRRLIGFTAGHKFWFASLAPCRST